MALRLDPDVPVVWRTTTSLQVGGLSPVAVFSDVTHDEQLVLAALRRGITRSGLDALAETRRMAPGTVDAVLERVHPVLQARRPGDSRAVVVGEGAFADRLHAVLGGPPRPGRRPRLVVLVAAWAVLPADAGVWLRRDAPHLPVVLGERSLSVGPLVVPGESPCLHCVERHRLDADPARAAVAAQLLALPEPRYRPLAVAHGLSLAARTVAETIAGRAPTGVEWELDVEGGTVSERTWDRHPECGCAAPPGSGSARARVRAEHRIASGPSAARVDSARA